MLKSLVLLALIGVAPAAQAADAAGPLPVHPAPLDCIRNDQVVCSYRYIDSTELANGQLVGIERVIGLPPADRVEVRRIDADHIVVYIFYPPQRDLQGVAF
jgi:hypothetical protein